MEEIGRVRKVAEGRALPAGVYVDAKTARRLAYQKI